MKSLCVGTLLFVVFLAPVRANASYSLFCEMTGIVKAVEFELGFRFFVEKSSEIELAGTDGEPDCAGFIGHIVEVPELEGVEVSKGSKLTVRRYQFDVVDAQTGNIKPNVSYELAPQASNQSLQQMGRDKVIFQKSTWPAAEPQR